MEHPDYFVVNLLKIIVISIFIVDEIKVIKQLKINKN